MRAMAAAAEENKLPDSAQAILDKAETG